MLLLIRFTLFRRYAYDALPCRLLPRAADDVSVTILPPCQFFLLRRRHMIFLRYYAEL